MNWQEKLTKAGCRISNPRRIVVEILNSTKVPLAPRELIEKAHEDRKGIGMVSVYRALELLTNLGITRRVVLEDGSQGYVLASEGHHHHIICRNCERVMEFSGANDLDELAERVHEETGFEVSDHMLQFYGLCSECQKAQENSKV